MEPPVVLGLSTPKIDEEGTLEPVMARSGWATLALAAAGVLATVTMSVGDRGCDCTDWAFALIIAGPYVAAAALAIFFRKYAGASTPLFLTFLVLSVPALLVAGQLATGPESWTAKPAWGLASFWWVHASSRGSASYLPQAPPGAVYPVLRRPSEDEPSSSRFCWS